MLCCRHFSLKNKSFCIIQLLLTRIGLFSSFNTPSNNGQNTLHHQGLVKYLPTTKCVKPPFKWKFWFKGLEKMSWSKRVNVQKSKVQENRGFRYLKKFWLRYVYKQNLMTNRLKISVFNFTFYIFCAELYCNIHCTFILA